MDDRHFGYITKLTQKTLILRYSLGKMYGDGVVQKRHFVLRHSDFSNNGVLSFYPLVLVMAETVESAICK